MPSPDLSMLEAIATTRAIRRYQDAPIPPEDLAKILFSASRAPTGSNRQSFRFLCLIDGPKSVQAKSILGESFRTGWKTKQRSDGYSEGSGAKQKSPKARLARSIQFFVDNFEKTPVVVLPLVLERHGGLTDGASIYPACQNLLLAARSLGYGGVLTGWHHPVENELRTLLEIPDDYLIAATIPLGKPVGSHGPVRRRPITELVFEDSWGQQAEWATDPPGTKFTQAGPPPT